MCTLTFVPLGRSNFVLTSNRDEAPSRETLAPDFYFEGDSKLLYPKDKLAGGTWIGVSSKKRLVCLLNGGFAKHELQDNYRLSRGVVVKDLLTSNHLLNTIDAYNLIDIEPFTVVMIEWQKDLQLFELVWDGIVKHVKKLPMKPQVWSSSALYSEAMKQSRINWFQEFQEQNKLNPESILEFHKTAGANQMDYGVIMDRGFVKTTSITQVVKIGEMVDMEFLNLLNDQLSQATFDFEQSI
ncbi:MAG TPA: NRDE family protein [Xanthomarina sp.]|nr:NRDE family protein [Xanthomarina sp.]